MRRAPTYACFGRCFSRLPPLSIQMSKYTAKPTQQCTTEPERGARPAARGLQCTLAVWVRRPVRGNYHHPGARRMMPKCPWRRTMRLARIAATQVVNLARQGARVIPPAVSACWIWRRPPHRARSQWTAPLAHKRRKNSMWPLMHAPQAAALKRA